MPLFKGKLNNKADKNLGFSQNPKILEVNLVKDQTLISFDWNKSILILFVVLCLAAALVTEIYFGLDYFEQQELSKAQNLNNQIDEANADVVKLKNQINPALAYKAKAVDFSALITNHIYWTKFFSWLENNTLSSVKFSGFSGNLSGSYSLSATAPTYADVSWQVKTLLNNPAVEKVEVTSASYSKSSDRTKPSVVSFALSLQVNPNIFNK